MEREASADKPRQQWELEGAEECYDDPLSIFQLIHPLGRGSYGSVYKARVYESGEPVAVKIIPLTEQDEISSIQKEVDVLKECNHPNVVKYYGSWRAQDSLWIAMEYCAGGSVTDIMQACGTGLEEDMIAYICSETLNGLAYLHSVGKVHRDIKCGNILLTESGDVKLADFGVAAQLTNTMSKRNTFIGTPHWMAPEVIQASHYDGKVDVWALGISAIEMAETFPPLWKVNPNRVIFKIVREPPPRLGDKERWSLLFQDYVAQCLQKDAAKRPTAKHLQQHKFLAKDKAAAVRSVLPLVNRARMYSAELAAAAAAAAAHTPSPGTEDGFFSWRDGTMQQTYRAVDTMATLPARSPPPGLSPGGPRQQQQQQRSYGAYPLHSPGAPPVMASPGFVGGGYDQTLPAASPHFLRESFEDSMSPGVPSPTRVRQPPSAGRRRGGGGGGYGEEGDASGTMVVRESAEGGIPRFDTVRSGTGPRLHQNGLLSPGHHASDTLVFQESPQPGSNAAMAAAVPASSPLPPSSDYLAAVQAVSEGQGGDLELPYSPAPLLRPRSTPAAKAPKTEAQKLIEKLHTLYSSGAVVPLPFLRATDAAPLALLGLESGAPSMLSMPGMWQREEQVGERWEEALGEVLGEASGAEEGEGGVVQEVPPLVRQQVRSSPVLLNLATTLTHHKRLLAHAQAAEQGPAPCTSRLTAQLSSKADDLADTLRTILCL